MKNLKIGQNVLVKALVISNDPSNIKLNIDKSGNANETINYVDYRSIDTLYVTTQELIHEAGFMGLDIEKIYCDLGNKLEFYLPEDICEVPIVVGVDNQYQLVVPEELFEGDYRYDLKRYALNNFMQILFKYAQTPIEYRGDISVD